MNIKKTLNTKSSFLDAQSVHQKHFDIKYEWWFWSLVLIFILGLILLGKIIIKKLVG